MNRSSDQFGTVSTFDEVAEQFVQRIRDGEHPSIKEYKEAFPQFAADIDELFPTLAELEQYDPLGVSNQTSPATHFQAPSQLGDYVIKREIGRGGMGVVYEAEHGTMRRRVALKVLPSNIDKPQYKKRFMREARAAGQLHHTNIVPVFEVGECGGVSYYAMQYIQGQNLDVIIDELKNFERNGQQTNRVSIKDATIENSTIAQAFLSGKQPLSPSPSPAQNDGDLNAQLAATKVGNTRIEGIDGNRLQQEKLRTNFSLNGSGTSEWSQIGESGDSYYRRVARVGVQIADALQYAHNHGVLHRDIKPSNLILDTDGIVWITDFGLAKDDSDNLTHTGDIVGTLRYMAPERFKGDADVASEVYSLGLTLYELCTLQHAFDQSDRAQLIQQVTSHDPVPPRRIRPEIPLDLETVIVKAIAREPSRRYSSARQMSADLQRFLADRPVLARRVTMFEKIYRWGRRNPTRAALVSCLALICLMITGGSMYLAELNNNHANELRKENVRVLKEKAKTEVALEDVKLAKLNTEEALKKAKRANLGSQAHLYYQFLENAKATKSSGKQGQNFAAVKAVHMAANIVPKLGLAPEKIERRHVALRSAAIGAMAHWDVETIHNWKTEGDPTTSVAFDFVNERVAHGDREGNIAIQKFDSQKVEFELPTVGEQAWVTKFSPDGRFFLARYHHAVTMAKPVVVLWDVAARNQILKLDRITFGSWHCFSSDSSMFAIGRNGKTIEVYATETGKLKFEFQVEDSPANMKFARHDTQLIVTYNRLEKIDFWSLDDDLEIVESVPVESNVTAMDWNDRMGQLAVSMDNDVVVWPPNDFESEPIRLTGHDARVVHVKLHPLGKAVMSSAWDGTTRLFDLVTQNEVVRMEGRGLVFGGFSKTGCQIGYYGGLAEFGVWKLPENRPVKTLISSNSIGGRGKARFVPGHPELLAYATNDGVGIWNHLQQRQIALIPSGDTEKLMFSEDETHVYTCGKDGLKRWKFFVTTTADEHRDFSFVASDPETIWEERVKDFDLNEPRLLVAMRIARNYVKVLNLQTHESRDVGPHTKLARPMFSADGRYLATFTWQGNGIKIWDTETGEFVKDLSPKTSNTGSAVNKHNNTLFVLSGDRRTEWSMDDWSTVSDRQRIECDGWAGGAAYAPDGQLLATTYSRYLAQLIDARTGNTIALLEGPTRFTVGGIDWSDDGRFLSVANREQVIVWDIVQLRSRMRDLNIDW